MTLPSKLTADQRSEYLQAIADSMAPGDGLEPDQYWKLFFFVPAHQQVIDPQKLVILGDRGCGKTHLFRALTMPGGVQRLASQKIGGFVSSVQYEALSIRTDQDRFATNRSLRALLGTDSDAGDRDAADLWLAYLIRHLENHWTDAERARLAPVFAANIELAGQVLAAAREHEETIVTCMRQLNDRLQTEGRSLIFAYDELDFLGEFDFATMERAVRGLLIFWGQYRHRWKNIHPKIFLRTDLFAHLTRNPTPETSKLIANRVNLYWSDHQLYQVLVKRLLNCHPVMQSYAILTRLPFEQTDMGFVAPSTEKLERHRAFIEKLFGQFMGANFRKGYTWPWILNHLRDGRGKVSPRALMLLIQNACDQELRDPRAHRRQLLHYSSIRRALDEVADHEVSQAGELPWIRIIKPRLEGLNTPITKDDLLGKLRHNWSNLWTEIPKPDDRADGFLLRLIEWGIIHERRDGRLDFPDLYRAGFKMVRGGGVRIG